MNSSVEDRVAHPRSENVPREAGTGPCATAGGRLGGCVCRSFRWMRIRLMHRERPRTPEPRGAGRRSTAGRAACLRSDPSWIMNKARAGPAGPAVRVHVPARDGAFRSGKNGRRSDGAVHLLSPRCSRRGGMRPVAAAISPRFSRAEHSIGPGVSGRLSFASRSRALPDRVPQAGGP
jgi:hypothetical protein